MSFETPLAIDIGAGRAFRIAGLAVFVLTLVTLSRLDSGWRAVALLALISGLVQHYWRRAPRGRLAVRGANWRLVSPAGQEQAVEPVHAAYVEWPLVVLTLRLRDGRIARVLVRPARLDPESRRRLRARLKAC